MRLGDLVADVPGATLCAGHADTEITGIKHDSRRVTAGDLYVVMPGERFDARQYVAEALARGAVGLVVDERARDSQAQNVVRVPATRPALADLAASFHGHPSRRLRLVGVTGTDGKTSTTHLLSSILEEAGLRTGWLTTIDVKIGEVRRPNDLNHTTPEADRVQEVLAEMVAAGVDVAIMESSSHALALDRLRGCEFDVAVFTNLSPEHLNFHGTMEEYLLAKARLFQMLGDPTEKRWPRVGIVNADDGTAARLQSLCPVRTLSYGLQTPADVRATDIATDHAGVAFNLVAHGQQVRIRSGLLGRFNVSNWLAAATAALELGASLDHVARAAQRVQPVQGRMEPVDQGQPFLVVVDFAHTPQALETALSTLRQHTPGHLYLAFGHAGERDPASRPTMGAIAATHADFFTITMDDPLNEDPEAIAQAIAQGAIAQGARPGEHFDIQLDRAVAIERLIARAGPGDAVLLAGKGHEPRMLVGNNRLPWSDREAAERSLRDAGYSGARN
ncbi:MAG: UDP-N-acetylmuramoyl-L-alanyl-D-glutamate--2,6-diaminopimelate ligase [Chloroflexota bacterium]